eukprot:43768-Eustigmatos_ZCMA.PRE.1
MRACVETGQKRRGGKEPDHRHAWTPCVSVNECWLITSSSGAQVVLRVHGVHAWAEGAIRG